MPYKYRVCSFFTLLLFVAACGGSDVVTGPASGTGNDSSSPPATDPSFAGDVSPIFATAGCTASSCHGGEAGGLTLGSSATSNFTNLVNVASSSAPAFLLIRPNNPTDSYLVMKLEGRQLSGGRMPLGGQALGSAQIATIRSWISAGAMND